MRAFPPPPSAPRSRRRRAIAVALLLAAALASGCKDEQARLAEHMQQAEEYREAERWNEAIIEYRNALQADPNHAPAHWGLARSYLQAKRVREGFWELRETVRLDPSNYEARLRLGQISLLAGELEEAANQGAAIVEAQPGNVEAHLLRGRALEGLKDNQGARAAYEAAHEADPESEAALLVLGTFHQRYGDRETAEELFQRLAALEPGTLAWTTLGRFYMSAEGRTRDAEAEAALRKALEVADDDAAAGAHRNLAAFYFARERFDDAERVLLEGAENVEEGKLDLIYLLAQLYRLNGDEARADAMIEEATRARPDDARPYLVLSTYRGRKGDLEGALAAAEQALQVEPANLRARLRKAEVLVDLGFRNDDKDRIAQGRAIVNAALAQEPSSPEALFVKGKLELADGNVDAAVEAMRAAIDARPDWAQAHFVLGSALVVDGDLAASRAELARALELDPSLVESRRILAQVHAGLGEHEYAVEEGTRYLRERPDDAKTNILVAQSLVRLGRRDQARKRLEAVPSESRDAETWYALGRLAFAEGRLDEAREHLRTADDLRPNHPNVLRTLLGVERARTGGFSETARRIRTALAEDPDDPKLVQLDATLALLEGDVPGAERRFERAIALAPGDIAAYEELARLYVMTGRRAETIRTYEKALAEQPDSGRLHHLLGVLYESDGNADKAMEHYRAAIERAPELAESKNNLAYLLAERGENLDRALDLAQEAKALLPDNANAADTLGWVLYKRGVPSAAIGYLREAEATMNPGDVNIAVVRQHLALAYEANGQVDEALASVERALAGLERQMQAVRERGGEVREPPWAEDLRALRERLSSLADAEVPAGSAERAG